jgi:SnoaL-like domain
MAEQRFQALEQKIEALSKELERLRDIEEIKQVQFKYGYYMDKCLYKQVVSLFANSDDVRTTWMGGIWKGKKSVERLYVYEKLERA